MKENHEIRTWKEQSVQLWEKMVTLYVALEKKPSVRLAFKLATCIAKIVAAIVNIPLRRSRLSGKMETTCPDRRKPL